MTNEPTFEPAGQALYDAVTAEFDLDPAEAVLLEEACRLRDDLTRLRSALRRAPVTTAGSMGQKRAHPLFAEVRAHGVALAAMLGRLGVDESGEATAGQARSHAGRALARERWKARTSGAA
jgi:hypothetical protein